MNRAICVFLFLLFLGPAFADQRRIGKRHDLSWTPYYELGTNSNVYESSEAYPDLSIVGALRSTRSGALGTGTLIAPNYVVTAAHVLKNEYDEIPEKSDWEFVMYYDFDDATSVFKYQVDRIIIHPAWIARQTPTNTFGDGDELGVDLALVQLNRSVGGVYPARLPSTTDDPLGERAVLAGFGTLVEGLSGSQDGSNDRRVGGENTIDRSVAQVFKPGVSESQRGGVLGIDFDSPQQSHNSLSGTSIDLLGSGTSQANPIALEASTAAGDSGGPAFCRTNDSWRVHGVVSYGTSDSSYGDVTVYTRLASHYEWLINQLPDWADSKILDESGWVQNPWFGTLIPVSNDWIYHMNLGWLYIPLPKGNSFWGWSAHLNKWIWLSDQAFPFIYCYSSESSFWMYLLLESSNGSSIRAYDYSSSSWQSYP